MTPISSYRNTVFTVKDMLSENADYKGFYTIAYQADTLLGMCKLDPVQKNQRLYLSSYIINPTMRGTGFNAAFFRAILRQPQLQPYSHVELKVHEDNLKAYTTYQKAGFKTVGKQNKRHIMEYMLY